MQWRLLLALAVGLLHLADVFAVPDWPAKKRKVLSDAEQIQGTWTATSWLSDGAKVEGNLKIVMQAKQWVLMINNQIIKGTVKLDPTRKVKRFDATVTDGPGKGITVLGIYRLDGNTWTTCWIIPFQGQVRPTDFVSNPGNSRILFVLKKVKR
jgi:uncharacterized protein (TIGR03067 family)